MQIRVSVRQHRFTIYIIICVSLSTINHLLLTPTKLHHDSTINQEFHNKPNAHVGFQRVFKPPSK